MNTIRLRRSRSIFAFAVLMLFPGCLKLDTTSVGLAVIVVVSGNNQNVPANTTSTTPLIVRCYDNGAAPLPNQQITWAVQNSLGTVSAATTTTDEFGEASVQFTAGSTPGPGSVTATSEGLTVTFSIAVT
jgi:hypothetical protein